MDKVLTFKATVEQVLRFKMVGPLVPYAENFYKDLLKNGYTPKSANNLINLMAHLSRWLVSEGLQTSDLTPARAADFLGARHREGYKRLLSERALSLLLDHLRHLGVIPEPEPPPVSPRDELMERYLAYLLRERALMECTAKRLVKIARHFLSFATKPVEKLTARDVSLFLVQESSWRSSPHLKNLANGLRTLLRFLYVEKLVPIQLGGAVPAIAAWRLKPLPKALSSETVTRLLASCDDSAVGLRDRAILTLLIRLGLRAGEAANLTFGDLDWQRGEIVIRGKGSKEERLPLPADVGEKLADWIQKGRPRFRCSKVFTRIRAPFAALSMRGLSQVVRAACYRIGEPPVYAHILRHTAATEMLRAGAGLGEIGQVLRHNDAITTAIYAKVDRNALVILARPWPVKIDA